MGPPVLKTVKEALRDDEGRLMAFRYMDEIRYFIVPDDGRPASAIEQCEIRPFPAFDAMNRLGVICGGWCVMDLWSIAVSREEYLKLRKEFNDES